MAPPPDSTGEEFPDFDHMTPEEQMSWLESLARRQGARDDELTTAADLEIPVPEDAAIDEPGYVPFEGSRSGREWAESHAGSEFAQPEAFEPTDEDIDWEELPETAARDEEADPMQWLETLSAQPRSEPAATGSDADAGEAWPDDIESGEGERHVAVPWEALDEEPPEQETFRAAPDDTTTSQVDRAAEPSPPWEALDEQPEPVGFEPEPELESEILAAEHEPRDAGSSWEALDQDVPVPEGFGETELPGSETPASAPDDSPAQWDELQAVAEWEASLAASEDPLAGADPMTWLESLAKRQGAPDEELTTPADLEIPEPPEDVEIAEPGYVPFSALDILPPDQEVPDEIQVEAERLSAEAEDADLKLGEDVLSWLREIAQEPEQDAAAYLVAADGEAVEPGIADDLAGLSESEIARRLGRAELTGEQELAWLERQAGVLAESRASEEDAAALPADLPDWLADLHEADAAETPDVPNWLATFAEERRGRAATSAPDVGPTSPEIADVTESELEAFVEGGLVPAAHELDPLAEALDAEFERLLSGTDSEPDWYTDAVARAASEETIAGEPVLAAAEPVDLPDWLLDGGEQAQAAEDLPGWLAEVEEAAGPAADRPLDNWLQGSGPVRPEIPPPGVRRAPLPQGSPYEPFRQRLEQAPDDHPVRLELARSLHAHEALAQSLDQYEVLVEATQLLDDVTADLQQLIEQYQETPRVHRLLGDTYLRSGQLREALGAYRAALERL